MKFRILFASAIFLTGCQTTQLNEKKPEINKKNTVIEQPIKNTAVEPKIKETATITNDIVPVKAEKITPQQQQNVWDRIAMQITTPIPDNKRINYYRNWYLKHPYNLQIIAERAQPFLFYITEQVEKRGMPLEIALLPIVESSFDQFAHSSSAAAGLWQIIPDTGRRFGLTQNSWYDGRRDIVKSTTAALDLLAYLNKKFDGNWQLTLAAYNTGEGRVFSAVRKNQAAGKPTDFWNLSLPKETSSYVPKLYAVADIIINRKKYGIDIPAISNKPAIAVVDPGVRMDLDIAAQFAGISATEMKDLNPAYRQDVTAPGGLDHLLLPINKVSRFERELKKNRNAPIMTTRYKVKSGDSLGLIAQRHNTSVKTIQRANNLKNTTIRIGQTLKILTPTAKPLVRTASRSISTDNSQYIVRSGDSLWTIARKHDTSVEKLMRLNALNKSSILRLGQEIKIASSLSKPKTTKSSSSHKTVYYTVRAGDSLSVIAQRHKVTVDQIAQWNKLSSKHFLREGQQLKLIIDTNKVNV